MRKVLLLTGLLICALTGFTQVDNNAKNAALQLVRQNSAAIGLSSTDINDVLISSTYLIPGTDITMVYLQQSYKGIPVFNQLKTLAFRGGKVVSNAGVHLTGMEKYTRGASEIPSVSAERAIQTSLADAKVVAKEPAVPLSITENGRKMEFGRLGASQENIKAELIWMPDDKGEYRLAWQVFVVPVNSSDYWLMRIDAKNNTLISKQNLTITCKWEADQHSIEDHFTSNHGNVAEQTPGNYVMQRKNNHSPWEYKPFVIGTGTYRVIRYPAESPQHPGGTPSIHTDPWTLAPGNATTLKWHSDPVDYNITRGNNVWAQEDRDANNGTSAVQVSSTTALPDLTFDYVYDFTQAPSPPTGPLVNQQAAVVNLFYFNNILHDITYIYGFDEVSGNFQEDNLARGGAGSDHVFADAQDGSGTNNANFATPVDGTNPRMQMYLWTAPTPDRDGDLDNGIIAHEFTHGVSNRLTGGPLNVSCLGNQEQGGEGWSDYFTLMTTTNWATATVNDGPLRRGIGTYALNQPTNGVGIRRFPYSTDMSIYPLTYADLPGSVAPHGVGEVWCMMIWEMTWEIIKQDNAINPNLFNPGPPATMVGNASAFKLVMEGMRLQPCSPGFVDARNAILQADQLLFGGRYKCAIWKAFAKRGLGRNALQGSSGSISDGVPNFEVDAGAFGFNPNLPAVLEGTNLVYTNVVTTGECTPMANFTLRDTLPLTVTWVSGGVYTPADRVVTFNPVNIPINSSQNFQVTVNVNPGTYFAPIQHINDPVTAIAPNWTASSTTANVWTTSGASVRSAPLAFFTPNSGITSDQILRTTAPIALPANPSATSILSFWHRYITENQWDGCVVEISTNGGGTWQDLGPYMSGARYNLTLNASPNPLSGRQAFSGNSGAAFVQTRINLASFAGQNALIRFRFGSDNLIGATGWYIDDILLESGPFVHAKSGLYDAVNARVQYKDTLTPIISAVGCVDPAITSQPASVVRCSVAGNGIFTVVAAGTSLTYQWQLSTDNGATWNPIAGATLASYIIINPTTALNGNLYRVTITGACGLPVTSDPASLYVSPALTHSAVSATPASVCVGGSTAITGTAGGGTTGTNGSIGSSGIISLAIPDNSAAGVNSTITLPALSITTAANLKLRLNMTHTWVGDVKVTLTSPCGVTYAFDRPGVPAGTFGNGNDLSGVYIFDLAGATVLPESGAVPAGTYRPSDVNGAAHTWAGLTFPCSTSGGWILNISDNAAGDLGTLTDWAILLGGNYTHSLTGPGTIVQNAPTGANNSTGNFTITALPAGVQNYTLVSTDVLGCTVSSNIVVTVTGAPTITTQPANRVICQNGNTTFAVVDNTPLPPAYQWQVSTDGGVIWTNLANVAPFSNVTTATLTVTGAGLVYNGNLFRVVITNTCGTVTSNPASLTVNPLPTVNAGPSGFCAPVTLTASGNANTYSWSPSTGLNTTTGTTVIASPVVTTVYTVTGTITATGCQNSASVTVLGTPATPVITPAAPVICAGTIQPLTVPATQFSVSGGAITIPALGPGSPYPSAVSVAGLPTSGVRVKSVNINGISHTFPADVDILLRSPGGTNVIIMSDAGGGTDIVNANLVFDDAAAAILPATIVSGTYRPTNTAGPDDFPPPGPGSITNVNPTLSSFTGNFNGTWNLYAVDDLGGDAGSITSWTIVFEVPTAVWTPITGLFSDANATIPYVAGTPASTVYFLQTPTVTTAYTYTVTNVLGTCSSGPATVTVTVNPRPTIAVSPNNQCGPVTLTATGNSNTYSWSPATGLNTTTGPTVTANPQFNTTYTVTGTITSSGCTNSATATVNATPAAPVVTPASVSICLGSTTTLTVTPTAITSPDGAAISIPAGAPATTSGIGGPYPATINIGGLPTSGVRVKSVNINGISHTFPADVDILLRSPGGTNVIIMSDAGGGTDIVNANLVFDDAAAAILPATIVSGTYKPTNTAGPDDFPSPGPGSITNVNPLLSSFTGDLNGNWNLYVVDDLGGDAGALTSWSITFEINGAVWTPITGLFTDPAATVPYVAGTMAGTVYAKPTTTTTYTATRASATCTSAATNVTVTVYQPVVITTQPANQTVCTGATATFSVVTTGNFQTYQWQISTNGGTTWTNIANANGSSLVLPNVTAAMTANRYRVIITNSCNTVTSNGAILTVNAPTPVVATDLWSQRICISDTLVPLVGTPVGGSWSGIGVSGFNFVPGATAVGTYILTYTFTNSSGCVSSDTTKVIVSDCAERIRLLRDDAVILYPNPNGGRFNIRMNSTLYNYLGMRVYTMGGQLVKVQQFGGLVYGRTIPIDIAHLPSATYLVKFYYDDGIRSSEKGFLVVVARE